MSGAAARTGNLRKNKFRKYSKKRDIDTHKKQRVFNNENNNGISSIHG